MSVTVNDVHAQLNESSVSDVIAVDGLEAIQEAILRSAGERTSVAVAGGRHAMGGQQFCSNGLLVDTRGMNRVLGFDPERGTLDVEAGIQWPEVIGYLAQTQAGREPQWGIAQKQTGADRLSIGGALAARVRRDVGTLLVDAFSGLDGGFVALGAALPGARPAGVPHIV
jgi:FAD/FMN-containing dehydrogenase